MRYTWIYVIFQSVLFIEITEQKSLDNYIKHYEEVDYDTADLHQSHLRTKRSVRDKTLRFQFNAFQRDFQLVLQPDQEVFAKNAESEQEGPVDTSHIYRGTLEGSPNSKVFGYLVDGHFTGTVRIPDDTTYHIEPIKRFVNKVSELPKSHSIIYKEEHLNLDPHRLRREAEKALGACGNDAAHEWMQKVAESPYSTRVRRMFYEEEDHPHNKYSEALNRQKRGALPTSQSTCFLYMQADPKLFKRRRTFYSTDVAAKEDIIGTFATHVDAINNIYSNTRFETFDKSIFYYGVRFKIQRTSIMTDTSENCGSALNAKPFCSDNIDVSNFLNLNSLMDHSAFCLAYIFTYRDFTQGTLGLAWVGSPGQASGGICETYKPFPEGGQQVYKSLNTGIVTLINYGDDVVPRVSQLTFAHEVGHNFGSPHDSGSLCAPFGTTAPDASQGNYIMYASATKGTQNHNDKFSECSKDNMTRVMDAVFNRRYGKVNCFKGSDEAFCGNSIKEGTEECDCGYETDCTDKCCVGRKLDGSGCLRKAGAVCSPSEGVCCDPTTCQPYTAASHTKCRKQSDCMNEAYCAGNATCPDSVLSAEYTTFCNDYSKVCVKGFCSGSLCSKIEYTNSPIGVKWVECFVQASGDSVADKEKQCLLGCRRNITGSTCYSSGDELIGKIDAAPFKQLLDDITRSSGHSKVELAAGSPCNNFQGYCDVFKRCRGVDAEGPLSRLKNLLFSPETFTDIREWIKIHWWAVILIAIGLILFMGLFIKVCAVHTPSSNPKAPPAQHWGDTLRRRRSKPRQQNPRYNEEPLRQSPSGPPPPYSSSSSSAAASSGKPHPGHGRGPRGKNQGKKGKGKDVRV